MSKDPQFPNGKLNSSDEGVLSFLVGEEEGCVVIKFTKPVRWLAMPPEQAVALAEALIAQARNAAKRTGKVLIISL